MLAQPCVFSKQSLLPFHCDPYLVPEGLEVWASLIANVRDNFAEFLQESYLEPLGLFDLPTCVGYRYGHPTSSTFRFSSPPIRNQRAIALSSQRFQII